MQLQHNRFVTFLADIAAGKGSSAEWSQVIAVHYREPRIEAARIALVRASIAAGEWTWHSVPHSLRALAADLLEQLRRDQRA